MEVEIGNAAGKIWQALKSKGALPKAQLSKLTGLSNDQVNLAIGWLAREGKVATHGWTVTSDQDALTVAADLVNTGVRHLLYTDISRDGMLEAEIGHQRTYYTPLHLAKCLALFGNNIEQLITVVEPAFRIDHDQTIPVPV